VRVMPFTDEYDLVAPLYGLTGEEARTRDRDRPEPPHRWLVLDGDEAAGAAESFVRPDDRLFLRCVCADPSAYGPLIEAAADQLRRPIHVTVDADDPGAVAALRAAGLEEEYRGREFRIRFDRALPRLGRARLPTGYTIQSAAEVDHDALFDLDNRLRRLTPGTDGWKGNRAWFDDEMAESPPFDPAGYLVALAASGTMAGLVRMWRNPEEPSLGLIGVVPEDRRTTIAAELLRRALTAASAWGSETFRAATSPVNRIIYPRMQRIGAEPLRGTIRFVRR
jgi:GNAT superfamily N-acetyltransferase